MMAWVIKTSFQYAVINGLTRKALGKFQRLEKQRFH